MPAFLFFRLASGPIDPRAEAFRVNADHLISYIRSTYNDTETILVIQGTPKPVTVRETVVTIDEMLRDAGYVTMMGHLQDPN